ncbi:hypothetical protein Tco_0312806 [Tanacetum coccineum]
MLWEWRGIANMAFIQLGGFSRVDEMILARARSGFAGEKYGRTSKLSRSISAGAFSTLDVSLGVANILSLTSNWIVIDIALTCLSFTLPLEIRGLTILEKFEMKRSIPTSPALSNSKLIQMGTPCLSFLTNDTGASPRKMTRSYETLVLQLSEVCFSNSCIFPGC